MIPMPTSAPPEQTQSPEEQVVMLQFIRETSSGGNPSPALVDRLNSADLKQGSEKFQANLIAARHNKYFIDAANTIIALYKSYGIPISSAPDQCVHPQLLIVAEIPDGWGGFDWIATPGPKYSAPGVA
jgi:hypothetical protein